MKAIVLGLGKSGIPAAKVLLANGYAVIALDKNIEGKDSFFARGEKISFFPENQEFSWEGVDLLVLSSGIKKDHEICIQAERNGVVIVSEIQLAFMLYPSLKQKIIAVTGTNGKTTTVSLIEFILNENGIKAKALGNIGESLCSYFLKGDLNEDVFVLELSSFQLENLQGKDLFDFGIILNIEEDHLKWHGNFENYALSKLKLADFVKDKNNFFISSSVEGLLKKLKPEIDTYNVFDKNGDNQNKLAAMAVCEKFSIKKINDYNRFKKPLHRIELVKTVDNVKFYNDSKSTNVASTIYAVNKVKGSVILIAGGVDKGLCFKMWEKEFLKNEIKYIFLIGESAKRIKQDLPRCSCEVVFSLQKALEKAYKIAREGDSVLFSPGCSSFDQFDNFEHRGDVFKRLVHLMEEKEEGR